MDVVGCWLRFAIDAIEGRLGCGYVAVVFAVPVVIVTALVVMAAGTVVGGSLQQLLLLVLLLS